MFNAPALNLHDRATAVALHPMSAGLALVKAHH
jgi:hypothetical protein